MSDGGLDPEAIAIVERMLEADPDLGRKIREVVDAWLAVKAELRKTFGGRVVLAWWWIHLRALRLRRRVRRSLER
jgi:hypothetical protein